MNRLYFRNAAALCRSVSGSIRRHRPMPRPRERGSAAGQTNKTGGTTMASLARANARRIAWLAAALAATWAAQGWAADASAAEKQLKSNNCVKCHTVDRKKDGPAYRDVAAKFRPESDAEKKLIHHMTAGEKVKLPDGHEESHKKIKTTDEAELKNLAQWILSLEGGTKY
jgi:cytochrome c